MKLILILVSLILVNLKVFAESHSKLEKIECGVVKLIEFKDCDHGVVEFQFHDCEKKIQDQRATKTWCEGNNLFAKYESKSQIFEATFKKSQDNWGAVSWELNGKNLQIAAQENPIVEEKIMPKNSLVKKTSKKSELSLKQKSKSLIDSNEYSARTPAAIVPKKEIPTSSAVTPSTTSEAPKNGISTGTFTYSGFVDFRLNSVKVTDQPNLDGNSESGYAIDDGKLGLNYSQGPVEVVVDIPFRRAKNVDLDPTLTPADYGSSNSTILFGVDKLQLFGKYKFAETLTGWLGQFDTPYGVEFNDSKDRIFSRTGLIYEEMLPVTHTGFLIEKVLDLQTFRIFSANSNNKGSLGNSASGDNNFEYGVTWGYANPSIRFQFGALTRPIHRAGSLSLVQRNLLDATFGFTWNWINADFELTQVDDPSKDILTSDPIDSEKKGTGALVLLTFNVREKASTSLRFESLENAPSGTSIEKAKMNTMGLNFKFKVTDNLETRAEFTQYNYETLTNTKWSIQRGLFSALFSF